MRQTGIRLQTGTRAGEDDRASSSPFPQVANRALHRVPDTGEVDVDHVLPALFRQLIHGAERGDPSIRDNDVQPTQLGNTVI